MAAVPDDRTETPRTSDKATSGWDWRRWIPWSGRDRTADRVLLGAIVTVVAFGAAMRPLRPILIADHPVALELLDGGPAAVGAAAAFARVGDTPLWLVVLAGTVGMAKFDWLTWWAGRRWGRGMLGFFMTGSRAARYTERAQTMPRWLLGLAVVASSLPGLPSAAICLLAGWARMRLLTFLLLDLLGVVLVTAVVTAIGYSLGQSAVDVVLLIDKYAGWVSLCLILFAAITPLVRRRWSRRRKNADDRPTRPPDLGSGDRFRAGVR